MDDSSFFILFIYSLKTVISEYDSDLVFLIFLFLNLNNNFIF